MTHPLQVSGKCGDVIVVIGGTDPANFQDNVLSILGEDGAAAVHDAFRVALVDRVQQAILTNAADVVMAAGLAPSGQPSTPPQSSVTTPSVPATQAADSVRSESDKFGRTFTYSVPGAPSCVHGPTVKMDAKGKNPPHKAYTKWVCPTQSPFAYRQRIEKAECDGGGFAK